MLDFWGKNRATLYAAEENATVARYNREVVTLTDDRDRRQHLFPDPGRPGPTARHPPQSRRGRAHSDADQAAVQRRHGFAARPVAAGSVGLDRARRDSAARSHVADRISPRWRCWSRGRRRISRVNGGIATQIAVPRVTPGMPSELLYQRPDIRQAEAQLASSNFSVEAARAAFFPQIQLTAQHRRPERGARIAVRTGRLVLHLGRRPDPADLRRLPAGEPVEAGQRPAAAIPAGLPQGGAVGLRRRREGAGCACSKSTLQERLQSDAVANSRKAFDVSETQLRGGTVNLITVLQTQQTLLHRGEHAGAGAADQAVGRQQPVPGARRRLDAGGHAGRGAAVALALTVFGS